MLQVISSTPLGRQLLVLDRVLASGGEGKIWSVQGNPMQLAKIYKTPTQDHSAKLRAMLASRPRDPGLSVGHVSLAWPEALLFDPSGNVIGFLMPALDRARYIPLFKVYVPGQRLQLPGGVTWEHLLRIACNIASVVRVLHARGYVLGDVLNESNILCDYSTALVCLVDCDSLQVPRPDGGVFRCPVGKSEFSAPELQGVHFKQVNREVVHDNFALAVLIFLLLMLGKHPFDGVPLGGMSVLTLEERIRAGYCAYTGTFNFAPPPDAPPFSILSPRLQQLFRRCFVDGHRDPTRRPTASGWYQALLDAEQQITVCVASNQHVSLRFSKPCPWCELVRQGYPDPFGGTAAPPQSVVVVPSSPSSAWTPHRQPVTNAPVILPGRGPLLTTTTPTRWNVPTMPAPQPWMPVSGTLMTPPQAPAHPTWQVPKVYGPPVRQHFPWLLLVFLIFPGLLICGVLLAYLEAFLKALLM